jgi:hypothetical protein
MPRRFPWARLPDNELLKLRLRDLKVTIEGSPLEDRMNDLYAELDRRNLLIRPRAWISDEWFSPDGATGIAIPFYLAHPRLTRLERRKMIDVEGGSAAECMRILRHEAGHVIQNAFQLHRKRRWQKLFGPVSKRYPRYYRPNPSSRNFVQHLPLWYGQSHPAEDFAETFAVWLSPRSDWKRRYAKWPAIKKLNYVDELMREIAGKKPKLSSRRVVEPLRTLSTTLAEHYDKKQAAYATDIPKTYDEDLKRIFASKERYPNAAAASTFLRKNRAQIRTAVAHWTGEHQLTLDTLIDDMIGRCRELGLRAVGSQRKLRIDFTVLLTAKAVRAIYSRSRRKWFAL